MSTSPNRISRGQAAEQGQEAVIISRDGRYRAPSGRTVDVAADIARARAGTVSYPPDAAVPRPTARFERTRIAVQGETTFAAARRLLAAGRDVVALNPPAPKSPGGGFLGGVRGMEESLCRASVLSATLHGRDMYLYHRKNRDPLHATWVIHSPGVPVFRSDEGVLLETPYLLSFLSSPPPNAAALLEQEPARRPEVSRALAERIDRLLAVGAAHGHDALVLGAWGCGVFGNDPAEVADRFAEALEGPFRGVFAEIVFAMLDEQTDRGTFSAFERRFAAVAG